MKQQTEDMILSAAASLFQAMEVTDTNVSIFIDAQVAGCKMMNLEVDRNKIFEKIIENHSISLAGEHTVMSVDENHEKWFNSDSGAGFDRVIDWHYWKYYKKYLIETKNIPLKVVNETDAVTSKILSCLEDPTRDGQWDRRGLVMGSVQSGKTGNYTGLIAKAIDSGYKFIVILTGTHNSLRSQTQTRINEELLGYDLEKLQNINQGSLSRIGVGSVFRVHRGLKEIQTLTTAQEKGDFKRKQAESVSPMLTNRHVLIIKKNVSILKNLNQWLKFAAEGGIVKDVPMLVIDDECDQASINTKKTETDDSGNAIDAPTLTNMRIRELLNQFQQSAYIGYSATPYANIFIHSKRKHETLGSDLFPRHFIFNLTRPSNYIGPEEYFGLKNNDPSENESLPLTKYVKDSELIFPPKHKKDLPVEQIPPSLKKAVKTYILSCVAKLIRETSNPHNSMLVHVTRFTAVQGKVATLIRNELQTLVNRVGDDGDELEDLQAIWEKEFIPVTNKLIKLNRSKKKDKITWDEIHKNIPTIISKIEVKEVNGSAKDTMQYKQAEENAKGKNLPWEKRGIHIIAIGGDKLSRGLTLEGLTISYYLRPSSMYDTLMQMGRWFGYREGYLDLCRIFTTKEIIQNFQQISSAEKNLKEQFAEMARQGATPEEFGLAVQEDPGLLTVTNSGKRRDTDLLDISFSGKQKETVAFDPSARKSNNSTLLELLKSCDDKGTRDVKETQNLQWRGVPKEVIETFLNTHKSHYDSGFKSKDIGKFVTLQTGTDISTWNVVVINLVSSKREIEIGKYKFGAVKRSAKDYSNEKKLAIGRIGDPNHELLDFSAAERTVILDGFKKSPEKNITGYYIRGHRPSERGLLLIYGIADLSEDTEHSYGGEKEEPYYGYAIGFPRNNEMKKLRMRVNDVWSAGEFE